MGGKHSVVDTHYAQEPVPPRWRLVHRPHWQDLPYFKHLDLPLVTSINLLRACRRKGGRKLVAAIVERFHVALKQAGHTSLDTRNAIEVLVNFDNEDEVIESGNKEETLCVLFVDHQRQIASTDATHFITVPTVGQEPSDDGDSALSKHAAYSSDSSVSAHEGESIR